MKLLDADEVVCCDVVLGELVLGSGVSDEVGALLRGLARIEIASSPAVLEFIDGHPELNALGIGWADAQLLEACVRSKARLFTHDRALRLAAGKLRLRTV
ncbi:MAG: hypothetical protein QM817_04515 [Archangium sp.]